MKTYRKRIADSLLQDKLTLKGAVLIEGPKWCGKTTTAGQAANSVLALDDPDRLPQNLALAQIRPSALLEGPKPRLLDEWQVAPVLWDAVRHAVDRTQTQGLFILTGSSVPPKADATFHTGTGRIARLRMRTMSLWESGESSGTVSLGDLFNGTDPTGATAGASFEDIAFALCRGGWPAAVDMPGRRALDHAIDYLDAVASADISRVDGVFRNPDTAHRLLRSLARLQGTQSAATVIRDDVAANEADSFSEDTVSDYLSALRKLFVVEDLPAWCPNLRAKTPIRTTDTRHFTDPSIATAALGLAPADILRDLPTFGLLFETLAVRDLRAYADALDGDIRHYRDKSGLECDAVIRLRNGSFGLVEIKLGGATLIEKGARSLLALAAKLDPAKLSRPSFLIVLVADGDIAYRRPDGIIVCPLSALKP
jgi:predicted AAA+ superfamily ATPase